MWTTAELLVNYGEVLGTMVVAGALADWSLNDRQRQRLAATSTRLHAFIAGIRRRTLLDRFGHPQMQRNFLVAVFLCDALIVFYLAHRMGYRGSDASARGMILGHLLLFVMPLAVAGTALAAAGPRLVALVTGRGNLPVCVAKSLVAAIAADALGYGALRLMNATFVAFGPRALLDWWDPRLWIYAVEYAASGVIVSAMVVANLLAAFLAASGLATMLVAFVLLQAELFTRLIGRYPRGALLGASIAIAGLAIVARDWI